MNNHLDWSNTTINDRIKAVLDLVYKGNATKMAQSTYISRSTINNIIGPSQTRPGFDVLTNILQSKYANISPDWLMRGIGEMRKGIEGYTGDVRPHIPFEVAAGSIGVLADSGSMETFEKRPLIPSFPMYDFTMTVSGRSMEPQFESGDIIAVRALDDRSAVRWGEVYVVASNDGLALKRVYQEDEESLRLVSFNPEYHPYLIPQTEDVRLFRVVGLIRAF